MGLLDSVLGSVLNAQQGAGPAAQGGLADVLGGLLGQAQGGAQPGEPGGLGALLPVLIGLVSNNGQTGGLGGLAEKFNQAGLGDVLGSWIGTGPNAPITGDQLGSVLGGDLMNQLATRLGMSEADAAGQLAQGLPDLIDRLTPQGEAPEGGFGNAGDLFGMLGGMLQK
ncbi:MAG: DUF937 domain-containing protein [Comamonadaceae bacterium]|mgnify:FL=1|jgi:uncharacterized protein YidB (DUF937 family)|uniref:YidB family protein n=1 Tax=Candidatus Skiveiella danica TaxID=3386177 RepID=UPI001D73EF34|nr:DUF937 domain-containing protein [Comamonadaceae bacterium]MBK7991559.1 DUF937 domain-containing protein [Comamonadaceae bacterium]MBK9198810.1 DUF937 domain-containing protein [Betaproteobacteria bacterium]